MGRKPPVWQVVLGKIPIFNLRSTDDSREVVIFVNSRNKPYDPAEEANKLFFLLIETIPYDVTDILLKELELWKTKHEFPPSYNLFVEKMTKQANRGSW